VCKTSTKMFLFYLFFVLFFLKENVDVCKTTTKMFLFNFFVVCCDGSLCMRCVKERHG
jgi:hypothetical protein